MLIRDNSLERWGKLKKQHKAIFRVPKEQHLKQVGFLNCDCTFSKLNTWHETELGCCQEKINPCEGIIIFGRYALSRDTMTSIQAIEIETIRAESKTEVEWLPTYDGRNIVRLKEKPQLVIKTLGMRKYHLRNTSKAGFLKLKGTFNLSSILLTFTPGGTR